MRFHEIIWEQNAILRLVVAHNVEVIECADDVVLLDGGHLCKVVHGDGVFTLAKDLKCENERSIIE